MNSTVQKNTNKSVFSGLLQLIRPKQWIKNIFVLAPLVFSGEFTNLESVYKALYAFFIFCISASAAYIVNDYRDIASDSQHPTKRFTRPLASGLVSRSHAFLLLSFFYFILIASYFYHSGLALIAFVYLLLNIAYSFSLKHQPVIDIFIIAIGFVLRVYAGAIILDVPVSSWMFVTTLCLALYLAAVKRRQELVLSGSGGRDVLGKYSVKLVERYAEMSATGALLFYSLFVMNLRPDMVVTIPLVLYGLFRYWFVVDVDESGESPTDALLSDWQLQVTVVVWVGVCVWIMYGQGGI